MTLVAEATTKVGASVAVDFYIVDQNGNKHTGSLSFSETASGTTYTDAVNYLRKLITSKINNIEKYLPSNISDYFKEIIIIKLPEPDYGIELSLPAIVVDGTTYELAPIIIPIQISNIGIQWHHKQ
jgi:hypothetical protein